MYSDINWVNDKQAYLQIKDYIKELILKGMLSYGEKLPSTRELAGILEVSRNTVILAYEYLEDEGYINIVKGKGAFVSEVKVEKQQGININWDDKVNKYAKLSESLDIVKNEAVWKKGMISFKSISPDDSLFNLEEFKKAFLNRFSLEGEKILNYGYAKGYKPLIDYLMSYMENKGVSISNKDILITNGFTEGFDIAVAALTKPGDKILCENPTHNTAIKIMKMYGLEVVGVDIKDDGIDIDSLKDKLRENEIKLAYLIPSYHNPTGTVMSGEKRVEVYNALMEAKIPIIEDGFNEELRYTGAPAAPMAALSGEGNSIIYIGSFSKILFPGIRIGWMLGDKRLISMLESVKRARNIHTSFLDQAVFYEYLQGGGFEKYIRKARKVYKHKYEFAVECAKKYIPCRKIYGEGGLHIFVELDKVNARQVLDKCYEKGVIFTPGDIFYTDHKGENTLRLGFSRTSLEDIEKGFKIIGEVVEAASKNK